MILCQCMPCPQPIIGVCLASSGVAKVPTAIPDHFGLHRALGSKVSFSRREAKLLFTRRDAEELALDVNTGCRIREYIDREMSLSLVL